MGDIDITSIHLFVCLAALNELVSQIIERIIENKNHITTEIEFYFHHNIDLLQINELKLHYIMYLK